MRIEGEVNIYSLIQTLKNNGLGILSSVPKHHIIVSVLGIAGLVLAIKETRIGFPSIFFTRGSSEKLLFIPGLHNLGNNCFLNVILQALAGCEPFHQYIESVVEEDGVEEMPLLDALASLFGDLCILHDKRMVLNPRRVMQAMDHYIPSFNLTRQQDAAEALDHLLSSLRKELLECYVPHYCSLADISALSSRFSCPVWGSQSEQQRWQQYLLGPFDGILCSALACRNCSSQLSMGSEFFHSLPLSPLLDGSDSILTGSSLEDCIKKFTAAELIENYRCNQCWHNSAIKYLSIIGGNETHIESLKCCTKEDSCDCRNLFPQDAILLSNSFSCAIKQLRITRCPKILCIQLQRASVNKFGESVKLQGHISFPMILDLFPFTKDAVGLGLENLNENLGKIQVKQHLSPIPRHNYSDMQLEWQMLKHTDGPTEDYAISDYGGSLHRTLHDKRAQAFQAQSGVFQSEGLSHPEITKPPMRSDIKMETREIHPLVPSKNSMYQLVSVVEHFGRAGTGHYTVYRRVKEESNGEDSVRQGKPAQWLCASDSKVFSVSERDVFTAEASMLFYERIEVSKQVPSLL